MATNPEINVSVHLHFHNGETMSAFAEGDILTQHTYAAAKPPADPNQFDIFSVPEPEPAVQSSTIPERPVAITPQTAHDQRVEIADYSERNKHLVKVDEYLSKANKSESAADRLEKGLLKGPYSVKGLERNAKNARADAAKELVQACGHCALDCAIRGKFTKWNRVHESAKTAKTADQESRESWRRRLVKNADAHCLPGKTKQTTTKKAA